MSALALRMHTARIGEYQYFVFWLLITITFPISQLLFPIGFLFCFYSVRKLQWKFIKKAAEEWRQSCVYCWWCGCAKCNTAQKKIVTFQPDLTLAPTVPKSTRVSPPSSTFFHVPYTNNFTHVTSDNLPLVPETVQTLDMVVSPSINAE